MTAAHGLLGLVLGLPLAAAPPAEEDEALVRRLAQAQGGRGLIAKGAGGELHVWLGGLKKPRAVLARLKQLPRLHGLVLGREATDEDLAELRGFSELRSLRLSSRRIRGEGLAHLRPLPALEFLDLSGTQVGDGALRHLESLPALRELRLDGTPVTDRGMESLARLTSLRCLSLAETTLTDRGIRLLLERTTWPAGPCLLEGRARCEAALPALESLDLSGTRLTEAGLASIGGLPRLRTLQLDRAQVSDGLLRTLAATNRLHTLFSAGAGNPRRDAEVTALDLKETPVTDEGLRALRGLTALRTLHLEHTRVSNEGLRHLKGLPALADLRLAPGQLTDETLRVLSEAGLLHTLGQGLPSTRDAPALHLAGSAVTDAGLRHLSSLRNLQALDLSNTKVTDAGLAHLRPCTRLRTLILNGTRVRSARLPPLGAMKELTYLGLPREALDDDALLALAKTGRLHALAQASPRNPLERPHALAAVVALNLAGTRVRDRGLAAVAALPNLERLDLTQTGITARGLAPLRGLKRLGALTLGGCPLTGQDLRCLAAFPQLTKLSVANLPLGEAALRELARLRHLHELDLRGTGVPEEALRHLAPLRRLRTLWLEDDQLTDEALPHLAAAGLLHALAHAVKADHGRPSPTSGLRTKARWEDHRAARPGEVVYLTLSRTRVSDAGLGLLLFPNLEILDLRGTSISAAGLLQLEPLRRLNTLQLDDAQVTDEAVEALAEVGLLHALERAQTADGGRPTSAGEAAALSLAGTAVSDDALRHLGGLTGLRKLDLSGTRVSESAVQELKRRRPGLAVRR